MSSQPDPVPCRWCGALIYWAKNAKSEKRMPFDAKPDPDLTKGWSLFMRTGEPMARYVRDHETTVALRHPHFETCTNYDPNSKGPKDRTKLGGTATAEQYAVLGGE